MVGPFRSGTETPFGLSFFLFFFPFFYFLLGVRVSLVTLHRCDPLLGDLFWVQTKVGIVSLGITSFFILVCNRG